MFYKLKSKSPRKKNPKVFALTNNIKIATKSIKDVLSTDKKLLNCLKKSKT